MSKEPGQHLGHDLRSYGRKRGRKPSLRQHRLLSEALPRRRINLVALGEGSLPAQFLSPVDEVWLEVGFGGGEHLLHQAKAHPRAGIIGCEPFEDGVIKLLSALEEDHLGNILLHPDDVRPLLRGLPAAALSKVFVLYPDPWPKARHVKRRLVSRPFLDELARAMKPGAELRIATDIPVYARMVLGAAIPHSDFHWTATAASDWRKPWPDWLGTRYEAKAIRESRRPVYLTFVRR